MNMIPTEHQEQSALFDWLNVMGTFGTIPEYFDFYAIPNGGYRHPSTAKKLKAEGVKAGIPDIENPHCMHGFTGLHIEMKRTKGYSIKKEQRNWMNRLVDTGRLCVVARGHVEAEYWIEWYFGKRKWSSLEVPEPGQFISKKDDFIKYIKKNVWGKV